MIIRDERDAQMIEDVDHYFKLITISPEDRILDIGGHIGAFGRKAVEFGVKEILAIEPYWENANLYHINVPEAIILTAGVGNISGPSILWLHGPDHAGHSFVVQYEKGIPSYLIALGELLKFEPTIIKSDCEEMETVLDWSIISKSVQQIIMEIHRKEYIKPIMKSLKSLGFESIPSIEFDTSVYAWKRDKSNE